MDEGAWTPCAGSLRTVALARSHVCRGGGGGTRNASGSHNTSKTAAMHSRKIVAYTPGLPAAVLYVLTMPSAALSEYWQAVVRANVRTVGQPLVDAPGVEDVAACVVRGIEIVTGCARSRGAAEGQQSAAAAPLWRPSGEGAPLGRRVWA